MPEPKYLDDTDDLETFQDATGNGKEAGGTAAPSALAAWMPLMCKAAAEDIVRSAATNVRQLLLLGVISSQRWPFQISAQNLDLSALIQPPRSSLVVPRLFEKLQRCRDETKTTQKRMVQHLLHP